MKDDKPKLTRAQVEMLGIALSSMPIHSSVSRRRNQPVQAVKFIDEDGKECWRIPSDDEEE